MGAPSVAFDYQEMTDLIAAAHRRAVATNARSATPAHTHSRSINVVVSLAPGVIDLPQFCIDIKEGALRPSNAHLTVYMKSNRVRTPGAEETVDSSSRHVTRLISDRGRNAYAYFHHVATHFHELADVEILTKTNQVSSEMVQQLMSASIRFNFISHPWLTWHRRFVRVNCEPRWATEPLYAKLCPCTEDQRLTSLHPASAQTDSTLFINCKFQGWRRHWLFPVYNDSINAPIQEPLVTESYNEGMFAVHKDQLWRYPSWFYTYVLRTMHEEGENHDRDIEMWATMFPDEHEGTPVWQVSVGDVLQFNPLPPMPPGPPPLPPMPPQLPPMPPGRLPTPNAPTHASPCYNLWLRSVDIPSPNHSSVGTSTPNQCLYYRNDPVGCSLAYKSYEGNRLFDICVVRNIRWAVTCLLSGEPFTCAPSSPPLTTPRPPPTRPPPTRPPPTRLPPTRPPPTRPLPTSTRVLTTSAKLPVLQTERAGARSRRVVSGEGIVFTFGLLLSLSAVFLV